MIEMAMLIDNLPLRRQAFSSQCFWPSKIRAEHWTWKSWQGQLEAVVVVQELEVIAKPHLSIWLHRDLMSSSIGISEYI